jgi:hypothetical protein
MGYSNRIEDVLDEHKGKTAYVCALGPSLKDYLNQIYENSNDKIIITCNDFDKMTNLSPDYWVWANSYHTIKAINETINKFPNTTVVHSDSVDTTPIGWIKEEFIGNYIGYDQRHFDNSKCIHCPNSCANFIEGRKTIQEILQNYTNNEKRYGSGCTVAVHMVALAIILGCKKIYLFGCDLDYSLGYVDGLTASSDSFNPYMSYIKNDFKTIYESASNIGTKIYNMSYTSAISEIIPKSDNIN